MTASAAQLQFAAEFMSFLAAAAGLALVALRGDLAARTSAGRLLLSTAFVVLAAAAFLHGASLVRDFDAPVLLALRAVGVVAAGAASVTWAGGRPSRLALQLGLAATGLATLLAATGAGNAFAVTLAAGAVAFGVAILQGSRRSIAARVAVSAAVTLLLFVLVLAVVLSTVVVRTVERDELRRLEGRAASEATAAERTSVIPPLRDAKVVAASLAADRSAELRNQNASAVASLSGALRSLSDRFFQGTQLLLVGSVDQGPKVLAAANLDNATALAIAGSDAVIESIRRGDSIGSVQLAGDRAVSLGTVPVRVVLPGGQAATEAVVVAVLPLDRTYVEQRTRDDRSLLLQLAAPDKVVSPAGTRLPATGIARAVRSVFATGAATTTRAGRRFTVVEPVHDAGTKTVLALVASTPETVVASSRTSLTRTLFVIALGGTLLALLLAALVGERIGAGLRRLTSAAESISRGDLGVRAAIDADDEVGVLGRAFDTMAANIEEKTADESRLRNRLEAVVGGMGEALVAVDEDGLITDFNRAAEELIGVAAPEAFGQPANEVLQLQGEGGTDLAARLQRPSPARWTSSGVVKDSDDREVPVAVIGGPLRGPSDELVGGVFVLRDLRREREVEQMKTEFLSRVGHELRTPLTGIMGYADLLIRRDVPEERARVWHQEILKQSKALFRIVQMLEFFASTGAGRIFLRLEPLEVRPLVDDVVERWSARVNGHHPISRRVGRGLPDIQADKRWLSLSLDELVDNAVKFSPGGGKVQLMAAPYDDGRGHTGVELAVVDRGNGMSADEQARAFADFAQGDTSDTRTFGGLGLGLSLVQRVAEAHGGTVAVESSAGKGSRVSIRLPGVPKKKRR